MLAIDLEHRDMLFITLCRAMQVADSYNKKIGFGPSYPVWRSRLDVFSVGYRDRFILGIGKDPCKLVSYCIPNSRWDETNFAETLGQAPESDDSTSDDMLKRLKNLF